MHPIIFKIGPFTIYSYGLMLAVAFLVSSTLAAQEAKKHNLHPDLIFNLLFTIFVSGIIGARIFYVISNIRDYLQNPAEIIMLKHGGLSWFGGLILGVISGIIYLKIKKLDVIKTFDLLAPFIALGQAIGRIGCLLNGCCYGKVSSSGIYFQAHNAFLIPTQAYSSVLLLIMFIILRILQNRPYKEGGIFFTYLFLYSIKRFFIEFWRADNPAIFFGLTIFQMLSLLIFCISSLKLFILKSKKARE